MRRMPCPPRNVSSFAEPKHSHGVISPITRYWSMAGVSGALGTEQPVLGDRTSARATGLLAGHRLVCPWPWLAGRV
jgi:hypothetical protein